MKSLIKAAAAVVVLAGIASAGALTELNATAGDNALSAVPVVKSFSQLWYYDQDKDGKGGAIGGEGLPTIQLRLQTWPIAGANANIIEGTGTIKVGRKVTKIKAGGSDKGIIITSPDDSMLIRLPDNVARVNGVEYQFQPLTAAGTFRLGGLELAVLNKKEGVFALSGSGSVETYQAMSLVMATYICEKFIGTVKY